jgi:hypothetical protein
MMPECFLRMAIWLGGLERWYLVLGGIALGHGFEPQSDLELSFAKILIFNYHFGSARLFKRNRVTILALNQLDLTEGFNAKII